MPTRKLLVLMLLAVCASFAGCANDGDSHYDDMNTLWKQGYGYNNPNLDRAAKGLPPQNFDGTISKR